MQDFPRANLFLLSASFVVTSGASSEQTPRAESRRDGMRTIERIKRRNFKDER